MKKLTCLLIAVLLLISAAPAVYAAPGVAYDGASIILSGAVEGAEGGDYVTVLVLKPNAEGGEADISTVIGANDSAAYSSALEYAGIVKLDGDAQFPQDCKINLKKSLASGVGAVYINFLGQNELVKIGTFKHVNAEQLNTLIAEFNKGNADYSALLTETNIDLLKSIGIDDTLYGATADKTRFYTLLKGMAPFEEGKPNADMSAALNFSTSFNHALALQELFEADDAISVLGKYNGEFWTVAIGEEDDFTLLGANAQQEIIDAVKILTNGSDLSEQFVESTGIAALSENVIVKGDAEDYIYDYKDVFGFDVSLYENEDLTDYDRADICTYIIGNKDGVTTAEGVLKLYNDAIESIEDPDPSEGSTGNTGSLGGSGSSGGSWGGSSYEAPVIEISPKPVQTETKIPFSDVDSANWAYSYIKRLYEDGVVSGKSSNSFNPEDMVTREEFVKIIVEALDIPLTGNAAFSDVSEGAWYKPYVEAAVNAGLIEGKGNGIFGVGDNLSRQDAAVILSRAVDIKLAEEPVFADKDSISDYAKEAIAAMAKEGIITGYDDSTFKPQKQISRAESCAIICRVLDKKGGVK